MRADKGCHISLDLESGVGLEDLNLSFGDGRFALRRSYAHFDQSLTTNPEALLSVCRAYVDREEATCDSIYNGIIDTFGRTRGNEDPTPTDKAISRRALPISPLKS
jgi:hypothetical protein